MPNLQYIGARYVPVVYDNPDDGSAAWKSGVSYENLVIVTYLDDSYTSRKAVPASVGNPANNPEYWAKTGDFNAALVTINNRINEMLLTIPNVINIVELGADNTGTNDNSALFNSIFGNHDYDRATFYFPDGVYLLDNSVSVNNGANFILSEQAIIRANASMDSMFEFNTIPLVNAAYKIFEHDYLYSNMKFIGGIIDANKLANKCLHARRFCNFTIDGVKFLNYNTHGLDTLTPFVTENEQTAELKLLNCYFTNFDNKLVDAIGAAIDTDNMVDNCIFVDNIVGLSVGGSNEVTNVHIWTSNDHHANAGTGIKVTSNQSNFTNVYVDCYYNVFDIIAQGMTMIRNLTCFASGHYVDFNRSIIHSSSNQGGFIDISGMWVDFDTNVSFTNMSMSRHIKLSGYHTRNTYCLPESQLVPCIDKLYHYYWNAPLEELADDLPTGIFGLKTQTLYKPDTASRGLLLNISGIDFPNHGIQIYIDQNSGHILTKFNKELTDPWFDVATNANVNSVTP